MTHEVLERHSPLQGGSDRSFGAVFTIVFAVIAIWPLFFQGSLRWWSTVVSVVILAMTLVAPRLLRPAN